MSRLGQVRTIPHLAPTCLSEVGGRWPACGPSDVFNSDSAIRFRRPQRAGPGRQLLRVFFAEAMDLLRDQLLKPPQISIVNTTLFQFCDCVV